MSSSEDQSGSETQRPLTREEWNMVPDCGRCEMRDMPLYFPGKHGIAAVNLWGEEYGFTRADVETLDDAIYAIHGPKMDALHPGIEQALDSIKERIEALLPPEDVK